MRSIVALLVLVPGLAAAEPPKLTLEQVIAKAVANPKVRMAEADAESADARVSEADASRWLRIKGTGFGTASPQIHCVPGTDCAVTEPHTWSWTFSGVWVSGQVDVTQPLYTFGKIESARRAARAGLDAQKALANETAGDVAADAARAYWGLKLARELGFMLDDGIEEITKAQGNFDKRNDVTMQDRQRVAVLLAEAKVQRADAAQAEAQALAGLRAVTNVADADIDDAELAAVDKGVPTKDQLTAGAKLRPQSIAAAAGARAANELVDFNTAQYYPDIALVGSAWGAKAQGAEDPKSAFFWDPFNRFGAGLVIGVQWNVEPWTVKARSDRARAEAHKAQAQSDLAALGASYDAETAASEARAAKAKLDAVADGEKAARAWLASVLQAEAIGTAEAKDFADAYIAWFQMRARWASAVFQWNVSVVRVGRATGEFRADSQRPR